jgi:hypothetical protein
VDLKNSLEEMNVGTKTQTARAKIIQVSLPLGSRNPRHSNRANRQPKRIESILVSVEK